MRATAHPVEGNVVRLTVEIDEPEVDRVLSDTVKTLARQVRVPGFRPGKVPRQVLEARLGGAGALRAEALREALPDFYAQAVVETAVDPIAPPEIDITEGKEHGAVSFDALVQIRPLVAIPGYDGLVATVPALAVGDEEITAQVDRMRETDGELVEVDRPAVDGDHVTIDLHGTGPDGAEVVAVDDYLYEVGSGRVVPELDEQLRGSKVGDVLGFEATAPGREEPIAFRVLVKLVQDKRLPVPTDEWVQESSEFQTLDELRADIAERIRRVKIVQAQLALRESALDGLTELVDDDAVPAVLVDDEVNERIHDLTHRLEAQKVSVAGYLEATGQSPEQLVEAVRADARRAVRADLALRALAEAEGLEVDDTELDAEITAMAERLETTPGTLRTQLDRNGRTGAVRSELKKTKAMRWLLDHVEVVDDTGAPVSRDELRVDQGEGGEGAGDHTAALTEADAADGAPGDETASDDATEEEIGS